jgi:hypothetical protein
MSHSHPIIAVVVAALCTLPVNAGHRYHASAMMVGGNVEPHTGAVSLSHAGGEDAVRLEAHSGKTVRFGNGSANVSGQRVGDDAVTTVRSVLTHIDIAGRIKADRIVAMVTARHTSGAAEAAFSFDGTEVVNLTIDDVPVKLPQFDRSFFNARPTFLSFSDTDARHNLIRCSVLMPARCGVANEGTAIPIANLGTLYVGEVFVSFGRRHLTMLRLVLDPETGMSAHGRFRPVAAGDDPNVIIIGSADANGADFLP